jgi:uncharacterized protein (TIGR02271 family)
MQKDPIEERREELAGQTLRLREEELVARKVMEEVGRVQVRTRTEEFPGRLEVEAMREEVEVEHVPVGQVVNERKGPWEEDGVLVVPVYEEQLVVSKRLVLKEHLRVRRYQTTERQVFEDTLRRERLVIDDPSGQNLVHERFPTEAPNGSVEAEGRGEDESGLAGFVKRTFG